MKTAIQVIKPADMTTVKKEWSSPLNLKIKYIISEDLPSLSNAYPHKEGPLPENNENRNSLTSYIKFNDNWDFQYERFKNIAEIDCLPKEVMTVTKDVKDFIKETLRASFELPHHKKIEELNKGSKKFLMELLDRNINSEHDKTIEEFIGKPARIDVLKDDDKSLIEEDISMNNSEELLENFESPLDEALTSLHKKSDYLFTFIKAPEVIEPLQFSVETWRELTPMDAQRVNIKPLEAHLLAEELEKGLEFRITPPFMDDEPSYDESKTSLEHAALKIPKKLKIPYEEDALLYFRYIASKFNEQGLLEESLEEVKLDLFDRCDEMLVKFVTASDYIIRDGECDELFDRIAREYNREKEIEMEGGKKKENLREVLRSSSPLPVDFNVNIRGKSRSNMETNGNVLRDEIDNSHHTNPSNKSTSFKDKDDDSDTTFNSFFGKSHFSSGKKNPIPLLNQNIPSHEDSLHVTKMATTVMDIDDTTVNPNSKRSLDDELEELITMKKRPKVLKSVTSDKFSTVRLPLLEYLKGDQPTESLITLDHHLDDSDNNNNNNNTVVESIPKPQKERLLFKNLFSGINGTIGFNLNYMNANQLYLRILDQYTPNLKIIEFEMSNNDVDFLVDPQTGIFILSALSLEQRNLDGDCIFGERLLNIKRSLKSVYVIISKPETYTRTETLRNFQLTLIQLGMHPIITTNSVLNHCEYIAMICKKSSICQIEQEDIDLMEINTEVGILVDCGVNHFGALEMLKKKSLLDILIMDSKERLKWFKFITKEVDLEIEKLLSLEWSIS